MCSSASCYTEQPRPTPRRVCHGLPRNRSAPENHVRAAAMKDQASDHRAALLASFLGWTLDAFDFFLVVFCLTSIGKEFGKSDAAIALSITVTLAFRPIGAFLFGLLADR